MDAVNVHIFVKDEPSPRQYMVAGDTFDAMKTVIKTTGARYDGDRKSWMLPGPNAFALLKQLRGQYTVREYAILRLQKYFEEISQDVDRDTRGSYTLEWQTATRTINTTLRLEVQTRQDQLGFSSWLKLPDVPVVIEITPETAAAQAEKMLSEHWPPAQVHGISIARNIVRDELDSRAEAADKRLKELLKNQQRTKENIVEAVKTLLREFGLTERN